MTHKILIVEDDDKTAALIKLYLEQESYQVMVANDGRRGLDLARQRRPDLIILDLMLPAIDGLDICRILRAESRVPIIMLTAKSTEAEKLLGLDLGADDYVTKPFSPREVVARVRTVLRRVGERDGRSQPALRLGELNIDLASHQVWRSGALLHLTPKEFRLLETMARAPGRVFSRLELVERVFGFDYEGFERTVDAHMHNLRKKIEPDPARPIYLQTVFGVGYKLVGGDDAA